MHFGMILQIPESQMGPEALRHKGCGVLVIWSISTKTGLIDYAE